jgi:hypothetical protein
MFYYAGGSAGGALPALLWAWRGWPGCVALVVAVQITTAVIGLFTWTQHRRQRRASASPAFSA